MLSSIALLGLSGCGGSAGDPSDSQLVGGDACSKSEPGWTKDVAPMVTREDGGEAAAIVHAVDVVTSGALLNQFAGASAKVSSAGAKNGIDLLTKLFTPDMSIKSEKLAKLKAKKDAKNAPLLIVEGTEECSYGGTVTTLYADSESEGDFDQSLTYSFDNCIDNPEVIGEIGFTLYQVFGQVFEPSVAEEPPSAEERVTLNGTIGAKFRDFSGLADMPDWMGAPSWSSMSEDDLPPIVPTDYLRGEIISDDFSAEFTTEGEDGSMLFSSSMDLYFEDRKLYDDEGMTAAQMPEPGFFTPGWYLIAGANGCLSLEASDGEETQELLSMRALNLETVALMIDFERERGSAKADSAAVSVPNPLMLKLNGFIEASAAIGEEGLALSLKADDFYRGYMSYWGGERHENVEPRPAPYPTTIMGYLGSACMEGMLFVEGGYSYPSSPDINALPEAGGILFLDKVAMNDLGYIEFNTEEEQPPVSEPQISTTTATLYVGSEEGGYVGTFDDTWSNLIGENSCTIGLAP